MLSCMDSMLYHEVHRCEGSNEWVVLIHGLGGTLDTWQPQIRTFRKKYNLLLLDMPGHGKSYISDERMPKAFTNSMFVEATTEVMDSLGIKRAHFISISLGSSVIYALINAVPERVITAVFGGGVGYVKGIWRQVFALTLFMERHVPWIFPRKLLYRFIVKAVMPRKSQKASRERYYNEAIKLSLKDFWAWMEFIAVYLEEETLHTLVEDLNREHIPTYWISGSADHVCRPGVERLAVELNEAEYFVSEGAGHIVNIDRGIVFIRVVLAWLARFCPQE